MNRKGFATLAIVLILAMALLAGGVWYYEMHRAQPGVTETTNLGSAPSGNALPPMQNLTMSDRLAWEKFLNPPADCQPDYFNQSDFQAGDAPDLEFYMLDNNHILVQVPCQLWAYQGTQRYYLVQQTGVPTASPVEFKTFAYDDADAMVATNTYELVGVPTFNSSTNELAVLDKSRGAGDCGIYTIYSFSNGVPMLADARSMECSDNGAANSIDPSGWPEIK